MPDEKSETTVKKAEAAEPPKACVQTSEGDVHCGIVVPPPEPKTKAEEPTSPATSEE